MRTHEAGGGPTILTARLARRRRQRTIRAVFVVLVGCLLAVAAAVRSDPTRTLAAVDPENLGVGPPVAELSATGWLNSGPLTSASLAGKVVLYDFWTYSCVSCIRTLGYLGAWQERYGRQGLVVIGVHSPRFAFERDRANVTRAVERLGVTWPVALDDERNIASAFRHRGWPTRYVADRTGALRYVHLGEGRYSETEAVLRELLGVDDTTPRARPPAPTEGVDRAAAGVTAEVWLRASGGGTVEGRHGYGEPAGPPDLGEVRLAGAWEGERERATTAEAGAGLDLSYRAREVNLVMAAPGRPVDVVVELDGFPLPEALRTSQVKLDADGRTLVRVSEPGLYRLVLGRAVSRHIFRLTAQSPGLEVYTFTFG